MTNQITKATAQIPLLIEIVESKLATATDAKEIESLKWWINYFKEQQTQIQNMES